MCEWREVEYVGRRRKAWRKERGREREVPGWGWWGEEVKEEVEHGSARPPLRGSQAPLCLLKAPFWIYKEGASGPLYIILSFLSRFSLTFKFYFCTNLWLLGAAPQTPALFG